LIMMFQSSEAAVLAGLTDHQLKEWCVRRKLLPPDVAPRGSGTHALFSWQTILALRLLSEIHSRLGGLISHWAPLMAQWRNDIAKTPFHSLQGHYFLSDGEKTKTARLSTTSSAGALVLELDPHLSAIASGLSFQRDRQLPLPPVAIKGRK
jgi:hypothetical protein